MDRIDVFRLYVRVVETGPDVELESPPELIFEEAGG